MTKIWKETGFVGDDPWIIETEETKAGSNEKAIIGLDAFLAKNRRYAPIGKIAALPKEAVVRLRSR